MEEHLVSFRPLISPSVRGHAERKAELLRPWIDENLEIYKVGTRTFVSLCL